MRRWARALPGAIALLAVTVSLAAAAGPPYPDPVEDQSVYDTAGMLTPAAIAEIENLIDTMESTVGAEMVVYTEHNPGISEDQNLANARALMDQWGIGRAGFDDGVVLMVALSPVAGQSRVSLYGGSGFVSSYASAQDLTDIIDDVFVPTASGGDREGAIVQTVEAVTERATPEFQERLETMRVANAALGLIGAPVALALTLGLAWRTWRREGDDPDLVDSPSILMAGPPADMTPALATVVLRGTGSDHSINVLLAELASSGRIGFDNLHQVTSKRSDDDPDPLTDPAMAVHADVGDDADLKPPQREAWDKIRRLAGGSDRLSRERLWKVNATLTPMKNVLEYEAVRLGWLARMPGPSMSRMTWIGIGVMVLGAGAIWLGISVPMSGSVLLGGALVLGGIGVIGFARSMSQRTTEGARVDLMLKAYRRTLQKTMEQSRSMGEVVEHPDVARLADTPDKAVVWGLALGLHDEVASVLARGLEEQRAATGSPAGAYYPVWLGSSPGSAWSGASAADLPGGVSPASGSIFSGSALPDIGGMFSALGSVGSSPPSSSSSSSGGGGFSGGGGGGGGGGSGSF
jgi:uncharacterized membrane protein YgcG